VGGDIRVKYLLIEFRYNNKLATKSITQGKSHRPPSQPTFSDDTK